MTRDPIHPGEFRLNPRKLYEPRRAERKNGAEIARLPPLGEGDRRAPV